MLLGTNLLVLFSFLTKKRIESRVSTVSKYPSMELTPTEPPEE
jgi:hypothetical protein